MQGDHTVEYFYQDGKLLAERHTEQISDLYCGDELPNSEHEPSYCGTVETKFITYLYGVEGITGFTLEQNGETRRYYYHKNIQGDILAVYNNYNKLVASYVYDAWGNVTVKNITSDNICDINPIRYRGYYYDSDIGLYYLKSRYYDPETGRFVNADAIEMLDETKMQINGLNLYSYCFNNPVMATDEDGNLPKWLKWLIGALFIVVGAYMLKR